MVSGRTKRVVVIKEIHSNIIEEAILILKNEPSDKDKADNKKPVNEKVKKDNDLLVKEANTIIENYIRETKARSALNREKEMKRKIFRERITTGTMINAALFGSIIFLIYMITRVI